MAYVPGVQYSYVCGGCGWTNELEPGLVPYMLVVRCPKCGKDAMAERRDDAVSMPGTESPRLCGVEFLAPWTQPMVQT